MFWIPIILPYCSCLSTETLPTPTHPLLKPRPPKVPPTNKAPSTEVRNWSTHPSKIPYVLNTLLNLPKYWSTAYCHTLYYSLNLLKYPNKWRTILKYPPYWSTQLSKVPNVSNHLTTALLNPKYQSTPYYHTPSTKA